MRVAGPEAKDWKAHYPGQVQENLRPGWVGGERRKYDRRETEKQNGKGRQWDGRHLLSTARGGHHQQPRRCCPPRGLRPASLTESGVEAWSKQMRQVVLLTPATWCSLSSFPHPSLHSCKGL